MFQIEKKRRIFFHFCNFRYTFAPFFVKKDRINEIKMKKTLLTLILTVAACTLSYAQDDIAGKLSISTQMFLDERDGKIEIDPTATSKLQPGTLPFEGKWHRRKKNDDRFYASPDTLDGKAYISSFVRLDDNTSLADLEAKGVVVQCTFDKGLVTALVPVDSIESVAGLRNVRRINVARLMQPMTDEARKGTNVDDILTHSTDAVRAGLPNAFDGTGVVLGVIDTGIDFQHIAFKDKNGNSRIKRAYVYDGSKASEYTSITSSSPTTDDKTGDHGTHTSSTAGGSSVITTSTTVSVTDDHSSATYGGMAPGADLYLAGINGLSNTYLANAFQKICNYADGVGKPVVISNSWGSQIGPHDGTGDFADIMAQYFTDSNPNHICLFAASNDGGKSKDNEGGGYHVSGTATSSNPLGSILRAATYSNTDAGYYYYGIVANAWARSSSVSSMGCKIFVLDSSTGAVKTSVTVSPSTNGASVSGLSSYFSGTLYAYKDYIDSDKTQIMLYTSGLTSKSTSQTTKNGSTYYTSKYTLAVQFYPTSGSSIIDMWGGTYGYFTNHLSTSGYTWTAGSDDMCVSDEATDPNVISIGAYVTKNSTTNYANTTTDYSSEYTLGDIAYFSSYATASQSPTGLQYPWICAPGARLTAGVNHYHTSSVDSYSYYGGYPEDLVVNSSSSPYAAMEGTSMATPTAAGIVALWLQAANEAGKTLTTSEVKEIMKETAINDAYTTTGANASHFGNGKIDALAGIQYILGSNSSPRLSATPTELEFTTTLGTPVTKTFTVTGANLTDRVSVVVSGTGFTADVTRISADDAAAGKSVSITFTPTAAGSFSGTVTLSSTDAESLTVALSATVAGPSVSVSATQVSFQQCYETLTYTQSVAVNGSNLLGDITVELNDASGMFSVTPSVIAQTDGSAEAELVVTYAPTSVGQHTASVTLSSPSTEAQTIYVSASSIEATPTLSASPESLSFTANVDESKTLSFSVSGMFISEEVTVTLSDESGVFSVSPTRFTLDTAEQGSNVTVTFLASEEGSYSGTVTLTAGTTSQTVALSAEANDGGTASDSYLNIKKYATIGDAGWTTSYEYTEYESDQVAWLTLPAYGAYASDSNQNWLTTSVSNTASGSWSGTAPFLGSSSYGTSNYVSYTSGGGGSTSTKSYTETFYVTGCTAVSIFGYNNRSGGGGSSSVSTTISVYACTAAADGTLTASTSAAKSATSTSTSTSVTLTCDELDENAIYKVVVSGTRAYLYEVAFCTPLPAAPAALVGDINGDGSVDVSDVTALVSVILGSDDSDTSAERAEKLTVCDINGDGDVNVSDITALVAIILAN